MLTGITEITRKASKASRSLVTIQARLNQVVDEGSSTGQALTDWYTEHNIALYDQEGQLRSLYDVLGDVANIWPNLTKNEQAYYLNQQAGANQSQNLAALLSNYNHVVEATAAAYDSAGSAAQENAKYMESIEARVQSLKATWQDFANNVLSDDLVKFALSATNGLLNLANNGFGAAIIRGGTFAALITSLGGIIGQFITNIGKMSAAGKAAFATSGWVGLAIAALSIIIPLIDKFTTTATEAVEASLEESRASSDVAESHIELYESLTTAQAGTEEYTEAVEKLSDVLGNSVVNSIDTAIERLKELTQEELNASKASAWTAMQQAYSEIQVERQRTGSGMFVKSKNVAEYAPLGANELQEVLKEFKNGDWYGPLTYDATGYYEYYQALLQAKTLIEEKAESTKNASILESSYYKNISSAIDIMSESMGHYGEAYQMYMASSAQSEVFEKLSSGAVKTQDAFDDIIESIQESTEYSDEYKDVLIDTYSEAYPEMAAGCDLLTEKFNNVSGSVQGATQSMLDWFAASGQSEHGELLQEDLDAYAAAMDALAAGEYGSTAIETAVTSLLSTEKLAEFGYDVGEAMQWLANSTESAAHNIYYAEDPIVAFGEELKKLDGDLVEVDGDNIRLTGSISEIAERWGMSEEAVQHLIDGLQLYNSVSIEGGDKTDQIVAAMDALGVATDGSAQNLRGVVDAIATTQQTIDPIAIRKWIDVLDEAGYIDLDALEGEFSDLDGFIANAINDANMFAVELDEAGNVVVKPTVDTSEIDSATEQVSGEMAAVEESTATASAEMDTSGVEEGAEKVAEKMESVDEMKAIPKIGIDTTEFWNGLTPIQKALAVLSSYIYKYSSLAYQVATIGLADGTDYAEGGPTLVNDGTPVNGSAAELIVQDGHAFVANNGKPTMVNLERGAKVYTAEETYDIMHGNANGYYQAFGSGSSFTIPKSSKFTGYSATKSSSTASSISNTYTGSTSSSSDSSSKSELEEWYDEWLKAKKHALAMDEITEEQYYRDLEEINEKYLKDASDMRDEYWSNQEDIYKWNKEQIEDQLEAEEKLQETMNNIAKAASARLLVYQGGAFRYVNDLEALSEATKDVSNDVLSALGYTDGISYSQLGTYGGVSGINVPSYGSTYGDTFNIGSVELADVQDVNGLFNGLKNLALQTAKTR